MAGLKKSKIYKDIQRVHIRETSSKTGTIYVGREARRRTAFRVWGGTAGVDYSAPCICLYC